jgi:signal transduction histidine kinase
MGLVIAKRLAELHGGTLSIEGSKGSGTTVTVKLPRSKTD